MKGDVAPFDKEGGTGPGYRVERISRLPANFDCYRDETVQGVTELYGAAAGDECWLTFESRFVDSLHQPSVEMLALYPEGRDSAALLGLVRNETIDRVMFLHILRSEEEHGWERPLMQAGVRRLRDTGSRAIIVECLPFCRVDLDGALGSLGFQPTERLLMIASLDETSLAPAKPFCTAAVGPMDSAGAANVLVEAYRDHPWLNLHDEVWTRASAEEFIQRAANGAFGSSRPGYCRVAVEGGVPVGAVVGCRAASDVGFVLHVGVRPEARGRGIGATLVRELAEEFRRDGIPRVALGVTTENRARELYERLGFKPLRTVMSYLWRAAP